MARVLRRCCPPKPMWVASDSDVGRAIDLESAGVDKVDAIDEKAITFSHPEREQVDGFEIRPTV